MQVYILSTISWSGLGLAKLHLHWPLSSRLTLSLEDQIITFMCPCFNPSSLKYLHHFIFGGRWDFFWCFFQFLQHHLQHKKWRFLLRISSVNVTKPTVSWGFGHIYWILNENFIFSAVIYISLLQQTFFLSWW